MIVNSIRDARAAAAVVRETIRAIQNAGGLCGSARFGLGVQKIGYGDTVTEAVRLRERLQKKLAEQERYAGVCYMRMMEVLQKIPSAVT